MYKVLYLGGGEGHSFLGWDGKERGEMAPDFCSGSKGPKICGLGS